MMDSANTNQTREFDFANSPAAAKTAGAIDGLRFPFAKSILSDPAIVLIGLVILVSIILILVGGSGIGL